MYSREWMAKMRRRKARKRKLALAHQSNGKRKASDYAVALPRNRKSGNGSSG
jgi:hypothetical protein